MKEEFARASEIFKHSGENTSKEWDKLFEPSEFYLKYDHYLRCNIVGPNGDANAQSWIGYAESRIRHIPRLISRGQIKTFKKIHLFPAKHSTSSGSVCYFLGLSFGDGFKGKELRLDGLDEFRLVLLPSTPYMYLCACNLNLSFILRKETIQKFTGTFTSELDLCFEHLKWKQLPAELFESMGGHKEAKKLRDTIRGKSIQATSTPPVATDAVAVVESVETKVFLDEESAKESKKRLRDDTVVEAKSDNNNDLAEGESPESKSPKRVAGFKSSLPVFKPLNFRKYISVYDNICSISWNLIAPGGTNINK
jgi:hypothetical protein